MALTLLTKSRKARELRRNETMSHAEFAAMKLAKFRHLVRHAQRKSPHYADVIKELGIDVDRCVPSDFPILTKSILMANFDRIVTDRRITKQKVVDFLTRSTDPNQLFFGNYRVLHTSGSSGEIGYFLYSEHDWVRGMSQSMRRPTRAWQRHRGFGRFRIAFYGAIGGHFPGVSMMTSVMRGIDRLSVKVALLEINSPLPQVIEQLNAFQPELIRGYTTGLKILAEKQNEGILRVAPLMVSTAGEAMTPADKAMLESAFRCTASNGYGSAEHLMMGTANSDGETMTLFDDDLIYEFFDDHSLTTNLFNYTQPLIRYHMSDVLRPILQANPSSPHIVVNSLVGRTEKVPIFLNRDGAEDFIHPLSVVELFIVGVARFQMQLIDKTSFRFMVILHPSLDEGRRADTIVAAERRLREFLDQKLMNNVTFEVVPVDDLPVSPSTRKFHLIVDAPAEH